MFKWVQMREGRDALVWGAERAQIDRERQVELLRQADR